MTEVDVHQVEETREGPRVDDGDVVVAHVDLLQVEQLGLSELLGPEDLEAVVADVDHLGGPVNVGGDLRGAHGRALGRHLAGLPETPTLARTGGGEDEVEGEEGRDECEGVTEDHGVTSPDSCSLASLLTTKLTHSVTGVALPSPPAQHAWDGGSTRHCPVPSLLLPLH